MNGLGFERAGGYTGPARPVGLLPEVPAGPAPGAEPLRVRGAFPAEVAEHRRRLHAQLTAHAEACDGFADDVSEQGLDARLAGDELMSDVGDALARQWGQMADTCRFWAGVAAERAAAEEHPASGQDGL